MKLNNFHSQCEFSICPFSCKPSHTSHICKFRPNTWFCDLRHCYKEHFPHIFRTWFLCVSFLLWAFILSLPLTVESHFSQENSRSSCFKSMCCFSFLSLSLSNLHTVQETMLLQKRQLKTTLFSFAEQQFSVPNRKFGESSVWDRYSRWKWDNRGSNRRRVQARDKVTYWAVLDS